MVQRKFTLVYHKRIQYTDFPAGIYQTAEVFYDMPLDYKIKKATLHLENDAIFNVPIHAQITVRTGQPAEIDQVRDEDDILSYDESGSGNSYTKITWMQPDRIPLIIQNFGDSNSGEWETNTQVVDANVKHTEHFVLDVVMKRSDYAQLTTALTTGDLDMYVILDCEVL